MRSLPCSLILSWIYLYPLTIGSSDRGVYLRWTMEGVDDWDKSASLVAGATPRRSTSSLGWPAALSPTKSRVLILVAAALLLAQGIYGLLACWLESHWGSAQFCVVAIIAGFGVAYRRWWSRPLVVALMLLLLIPGIWFGWRTAAAGVFRNRQAFDICLLLLPGVGYLGLSIFCAYVALRHVPGRKRRSQT
jgi:hypothetical protein